MRHFIEEEGSLILLIPHFIDEEAGAQNIENTRNGKLPKKEKKWFL